MENIYYCYVLLTLIAPCLMHEGAESVVTHYVEAILELLPESVTLLLDEEPLGLNHSTAFFLLLSSVIVLTLSSISACFKLKSRKGKLSEIDVLRNELAAQRKIAQLQDNELSDIQEEIQQKQDDFLCEEHRLLSKIEQKDESVLATPAKVDEIAHLKEQLAKAQSDLKIEKEKSQELSNEQESLKNQVDELKHHQEILDGDYRNEISKQENEFQKLMIEKEECHKAKLEKIGKMQTDLKKQKSRLQREVIDFEMQLLETRTEEKYDEMCEKMEDLHNTYKEKIRETQTREHTHWLSIQEMERRRKAEIGDTAMLRVMLSDMHKKMKMDYYCNKSALAERRVLFKDDNQVVSYIKQEAPAHSIEWDTLSQTVSQSAVQEMVYMDPSDLV